MAGLGPYESVSLQDNGANTVTVSANGAFSFPVIVDGGATYAVMVQSHTPGIACSVSNGSGTVGSSDVTGISVSCGPGSEKILYSFGANATDGSGPSATPILDSAGNLYGITSAGGANGLYDGTVYKISPEGTETILHSFGASATDGQMPSANASLVMDSAGNLYGTTTFGGANGEGTVYKISPDGTETILHSFSGGPGDGAEPYAGVIMASSGNLYGTTSMAGANGGGTVFKIDTAGHESVLYSFAASSGDGDHPLGGLVMDSAGNLYGTTQEGGFGSGTVFKLGADGTESILYDIGASFDGEYPCAGVAMDSGGNLYGTTAFASESNGTVFEIGANGRNTLLYAFGAGNSGFAASSVGVAPYAGVMLDSAGNLYGTTAEGGSNGFYDGAVYKLSPDGTETVIYSFGASAMDGTSPNSGVIADSAGNLCGTTVTGEANGKGTVYVID